MPLKLTWRINKDKNIDLMVNDEQRISETMHILSERGILPEDIVEKVRHVKSLRTKNQVNILMTYNEADIYSGDILEITDNI